MPQHRWLVLLFAAGCGPGELPDELAEPTAWLFGHFDDREDDVAAQLAALALFAAGRDPEDPVDRRAYAPSLLDETHTDDVDQQPLPDDAAAVALVGRSDFELRDHRRQFAEPVRGCFHGAEVAAWERAFEDGESCFGDGLCKDALVRDTVSLATPTAEVSLRRQIREIVLEDGRDALVARAWADDGQTWFSLDAWVPDETDTRRTWRMQAAWQTLDDADWALAHLDDHLGAAEAALVRQVTCEE
jgi:hypothetical protein